MLIATDSFPSPSLFLLHVYGVWQTNLHRQHQGIPLCNQIICSRARKAELRVKIMAGFKENLITCFLLLTCKQIRNTNREMNNERIYVYLCAWINVCIICKRMKHRERRHFQRETQNQSSAFRKKKRQRNPGDVVLISARHSPTQTAELVRMTLVGEQEWINSIWHGDEPWPFRMRGGGCRDGTHNAVGVIGWHRCRKKMGALGCICVSAYVCLCVCAQGYTYPRTEVQYVYICLYLSAKCNSSFKMWHRSSVIAAEQERRNIQPCSGLLCWTKKGQTFSPLGSPISIQ